MSNVGSSAERSPSVEVRPSAFAAEVVRQAERADAVFLGVIEHMEHQSSFESLPNGARAEWPFTYVTYRILEGIKGGIPGESITLRFIGGVMQDGRRAVEASRVPAFNLGNTDILFVRENGTWWCPLAGAENGLYRVVGGKVYSHDGHAVVLDAGQLALGAPEDLPESRISLVAGRRLDRTVGVSSDRTSPAHGPAVDAAAFSDAIRVALARSPALSFSAAKLSVTPSRLLDSRATGSR